MSSAPGRRVVVVAVDPLPLPGLATSGAGLRAWQLGQGLLARGHDVTFLSPERVLRAGASPLPERVRAYEEHRFRERVHELQPEVVVFQHWAMVEHLEQSELPIALDLHGPVLLEIASHDRQRAQALIDQKVRAFRRADFLSCAGKRQRAYFYAWMLLAGYDLRESTVAVIPVALAPTAPEHHPPAEPVFVYGGVFLPWQDPSVGLTTLVETLERRGRGRLKLFAGPHAFHDLPVEHFTALVERLRASPRVEHHGLVPHAELLEAYRSASVAFDLMAPNSERELAFTTRTVEYLWCGLPVIYNDYAELAEYIGSYNAGWIVDPCDRGAIRRAIEEVLDAPEAVAERSRNARRLIRERLNWEVAIEPLDRFCRDPRRRGPGAIAAWHPTATDCAEQLAYLTSEIERKNRHIAELEQLIARIENGRVMRILRRFARW